jgi:hypothetical protein
MFPTVQTLHPVDDARAERRRLEYEADRRYVVRVAHAARLRRLAYDRAEQTYLALLRQTAPNARGNDE